MSFTDMQLRDKNAHRPNSKFPHQQSLESSSWRADPGQNSEEL